MSRIIRPGARLVEEFVYHQEKLPTDRPIAQYIRQSTEGQVKKNIQSYIQQDEKFTRRLVTMGWQDTLEFIRKIEADQGISGQKREDERGGLHQLYQWIEHREIGAVGFYDASRLWRDPTHIWYNDFIQRLETYHIPVLTFSRIYWPNSQQDMDALREEFRQAAFYLRHIYEKVLPAKMQAIEDNASYGGGCVPMGYIVVGEKGERRYYVPYEPHARLIRYLFRRYRELGGNLGKLGRELRDTGFTFPPFEGVEKIPHVSLQWNGNGYALKTRQALISILTNPAYIGWYVYNGVVVSREAHEPLVSYEDFGYARIRLSSTTLENEVNEQKPPIERRYGVACNALLEGILTHNGNPVYVMAHSQTYTARKQDDGWKKSELVLSVQKIDEAFTGALRALLVALEQRHRDGLQDSLYEQLAALHAEKAEEGNSLNKALAQVEKGIRKADMDKRIALEEEYEPGVRAATKQLKNLHHARTALEDKIRRANKEREELEESLDLTQTAIERWEALPFDRQHRFVKLLVKSANVQEVTPHIVRLDIKLNEPIPYTLVGHIYRHRGSKPAWTVDENQVIRTLYPHADRLEILKALPRRTWESIIMQAIELGVERYTRLNSSHIHESFTYSDVMVGDELQAGGFPLTTTGAVWAINGGDVVDLYQRMLTALHTLLNQDNSGVLLA